MLVNYFDEGKVLIQSFQVETHFRRSSLCSHKLFVESEGEEACGE